MLTENEMGTSSSYNFVLSSYIVMWEMTWERTFCLLRLLSRRPAKLSWVRLSFRSVCAWLWTPPCLGETDTRAEDLGLSTLAPLKYTRLVQLYIIRKHININICSPIRALSNLGQFFIFGELFTEGKLNSIVIICQWAVIPVWPAEIYLNICVYYLSIGNIWNTWKVLWWWW